MSLDIYVENPDVSTEARACPCCGHTTTNIYHEKENANITHNLREMFNVAGIGDTLWGDGGQRAGDIIPELEVGLQNMLSDPEKFKQYDAPNGWGTYPDALRFLKEVIDMCKEHPDWIIRTSK